MEIRFHVETEKNAEEYNALNISSMVCVDSKDFNEVKVKIYNL
jgi:hypothetical protein